MERLVFRAMGTNAEIIAAEAQSSGALHLAKERMLALESLLTRFRDDSDVSRINSANGQWVEVSADTVQILLLTQDAFSQMRGFFNPFMGHVLENLGYNRTFEKIGDQSNVTLSIGDPFLAPIHSPLEIDTNSRRARIEPGYKLDLGGIAKGWIVEQSADVLMNEGITNFICNAGGDLVCRGLNEGHPWVVGIADPFDPATTMMNLDVHNMCVATSGTYRRKWSANHTTVHHILDPFLGQPAETDIVSCSVFHQSLVQAELLAKVALILGTTKAIPWLNEQTNEWVLVTQGKELIRSCNLSTNDNVSPW